MRGWKAPRMFGYRCWSRCGCWRAAGLPAQIAEAGLQFFLSATLRRFGIVFALFVDTGLFGLVGGAFGFQTLFLFDDF